MEPPMTTPSRHLSMSTLTAGTILAVAAIGLTAPSSAAASTDAKNPAPNIEGSRITVTSGTSNPIPVASSYEDYRAGRVATVEHNRPHISAGYNNHAGPVSKVASKSGKRYAEFSTSIDSSVYLGHGYWIGAHNNWGDSKQLVIAKFDTESKPKDFDRAQTFSVAHHDEAGIEGGKTISMGKLSAKVRYTGCNGDSYNWSVELVRYTPVTTKVSVRNFTDKLVKVASNNEDFVKNPALLYYKYNEHLNSGYEDKRAPRSTDCDEQGRRDTTFSSNNDATVYLGGGFWLGAVSDNATTTFTFAKFDNTGADPADGSKPTSARAFSQPLYRWEPYGHVVEIDGLKLRVMFHGVSTSDVSYSVEILDLKHQ